ncbi:MAG: hypothetical protein DRH33_08515 [Candidatus Nealsonbacteria bacterium]|nr:MAG: hypothetical protein DRH33_08515 [Candidatus Nealsonbacteria bacterium]
MEDLNIKKLNKNYEIDHVGFIVKDIDKSIKEFSNYLKIKDWRRLTIKPPLLIESTLYGEKVEHTFEVALGTLNNFYIELLMPLEGDSIYKEFLQENGEGPHHIDLLFKKLDDLEKKVKEMIEEGGEIIQSGMMTTGRYYYVKKNKLILELRIKY